MIKNGCVQITVSWEGKGCKVLQIQEDISELNEQGYFFLEEGFVDVGKVQTIPDRFAKVALRSDKEACS